MTPIELYNLMEPCREAMVKDGIWPTRKAHKKHSRSKMSLFYHNDDKEWEWKLPGYVSEYVHPDDAHNAFLAALLGWALGPDTKESYRHIWYCKDGHYHVGHYTEHSQYLLHALVSACRQAKGKAR